MGRTDSVSDQDSDISSSPSPAVENIQTQESEQHEDDVSDEEEEDAEDDNIMDAEEVVRGGNGRDKDIRSVKGIGAKSEELLRSKNIHTVGDLFDVIHNDPALLTELNKEIRGFSKIVKRVSDIMTLQNH